MGDQYSDGSTGQAISFSRPVWMSIAAFTGVAWYNAMELNIQVFLTFKRHRGLYFWSLLISSYGCILHALGFLLKFFQVTTNNYLSVTIITIGWYGMVTGQAVVLYSRLHLVVREQKVLRGILAMIIVDAICFHIPTTVLTYGSNSPDYKRYLNSFNVVERLQMTAFCIQEFIISGVYVYSTIRLLRPVYHGRTRKVMMQLIWINSIIIAMDVVLLGMEYSSFYEIEATLKAMVYSIKLKLEFAVLNQLMTLANSSVSNAQHLQIHDDAEGQKGTGEGHKRTRSLEYLSRFHYPRPKPPGRSRQANAPTAYNEAEFSSVTKRPTFGMVPSLDRNCYLGPRHVEKAEEPPNVFTNPAAFFRPGKQSQNQIPPGFPSHDGLGGIPSPTSPTLTGSTLNPAGGPHQGRQGHQNHQGQQSHQGRRAPPPPALNLNNQPEVMPNGLLRSTRPSVSDWAHGPDSQSEISPNSDEIQLDPFESRFGVARSPGSVKQGRHMAERNMGMDFMTSALRE
ncbi:MAG: hypothetical protein LQ351_001624 [Letrouitia transgressa]|nr:MAG: hypothetical protein LQ351_001624 [Letrouitia transgressa]